MPVGLLWKHRYANQPTAFRERFFSHLSWRNLMLFSSKKLGGCCCQRKKLISTDSFCPLERGGGLEKKVQKIDAKWAYQDYFSTVLSSNLNSGGLCCTDDRWHHKLIFFRRRKNPPVRKSNYWHPNSATTQMFGRMMMPCHEFTFSLSNVKKCSLCVWERVRCDS